ncbi:hypothetical protein D3C81_1043390 [compost metagenome]
MIVRADHRRHSGGARGHHRPADIRLERFLARLQLLVTLELQIGGPCFAPQALVLAAELADLHPLLAQGVQVAVQLAQQLVGTGRAAVVRPLPLLAQLDGFANGAFQHLGLVALGFQLLDAVFGGLERGTE